MSKNVINFKDFKQKKIIEEKLAEGRQPLYVSHKNKKITGNPHLNGSHLDQDFGDRVQRIKISLEKINNLMAELKKMAKSEAK